jgi:murein DD-endopeptidase MepM/ murein hydrolase activator NlpD
MTNQWPTQEAVDAYTAARAPLYGINPSTAITVRRSESGSGFVGDHGTSFGPFQLHYGGGLGDAFTQSTGLSARDPANWQATVDFALQHASRNGWQAFHGAARVGVGLWDGIGRVGQAIGGAVTGAISYFFPVVGYSGDPTKSYHTAGATDLFAPLGAIVRAVVSGRVVSTSTSGPGGNSIEVHGVDGLDYYYAHLKDAVSVTAGDFVAGGQNIGAVGNTGNATGKPPHLHIGIGHGIQGGTGATGGAGIGFDAQSFLSRLLAMGGSGNDLIGGLNNVGIPNPMASVPSGVQAGVDYIHQQITNYVQNRAASFVLLASGIFLLLIGIWGFVQRSGIVKTVVKTVGTAVAPEAGPIISAA